MTTVSTNPPLALGKNAERLDADKLDGEFANPAHYQYFFDYDKEVWGEEGLVARLVIGCLDEKLVEETAKYLRTVHGDGSNRGVGVGKGAMMYTERPDKTLGFTQRVPKSIIEGMRERGEFTDFLGWMDKSKTGDRFDYCRETNWSLDDPEVLEAARPFVKAVDEVYRKYLPEQWQKQRDFMDKVLPDFKFNDSVFSTVTVNRNKRFIYHRDKYDFRGGMGNLVVLEGGDDRAGAIVMPRYRVAFAPRPTDVLFMNVHELHGHLPLNGVERVSAVLYAREHLDECEVYKATDDDLPENLR
jgi:hypothetical protein